MFGEDPLSGSRLICRARHLPSFDLAGGLNHHVPPAWYISLTTMPLVRNEALQKRHAQTMELNKDGNDRLAMGYSSTPATSLLKAWAVLMGPQ